MAKINSLSVYLENGTSKDFLSEQYGGVIENIQTKTISGELKNKDLSGEPGAGTVQAKRFVNATVSEYGTARSGGKGQKVKARPVDVSINVDREIIEEVEEKDVKLYGVEGFIQRRVANHNMRMAKDLERAFFTEAATAGTALELTATEAMAQADEAIVACEGIKNDFVDGVDRMYMTIVANPSFYSALQAEIDTISNPNVDSGAAEIDVFHGCRIKKSIDLPSNVKFMVYVDGSVAQPVIANISELSKIPMSNAYSFGIFYSYGTKAVAPDLILVVSAE